MAGDFMRKLGSAAVLASAILAAAFGGARAEDAAGRWSERVQVFHDAETQSVYRSTIRVWDDAPEKNLDFLWEPAPGKAPQLAADGTLSGEGRLTWRVRGAPSYDPGAVFAVYEGMLRDGRPDGQGRLERRSGETFEGTWNAGVLQGEGVFVDSDGNRYEGAFRDGEPEGTGRLLLANGEIYEGPFVAGRRHGTGRSVLPGGTAYASTWSMGVETGERPNALADADGGGLLRVQSGRDAAARTEFSITVDQRMNQQSEVRYLHLMRENDIAIYPENEQINEAWNGNGEIPLGTWIFQMTDWESAAVFIDGRLATTDNSRVKVDTVQLEVASSESYRKPMLSMQAHDGCVGFRPTFSLVNHGWGAVEDATATVRFTGERDYSDNPQPQPQTRSFQVPVGSFDDGVDVSIRNALIEAGVDVTALETKRFPCPSEDRLGICRAQLFNGVSFGEIAGVVFGEDKIMTRAVGEMNYRWADAAGNRYAVTEPFSVDINLARIEVERTLAECGDVFGGSPDALRYVEVKLPVDQSGYTVDLPLRGNKNIREYAAKLKVSADQTSVHRFQATARFADGSIRRSKPVTLFYYRPRETYWTPQVRLPACYLPNFGPGC